MVDEARISQLLTEGDVRRAAEETIKALGPRMLGYLSYLLDEPGDVGDAFSLFAENVFRGLPGFRRESSLLGWVYALAFNAAANVRDSAWKRLGRRLDTTEASRIAEEVRSSWIPRVEQQQRALDALRATLTLEEKTLLILRVDQAMPWNDVANIMAGDGPPLSAATVRKRFERLTARLAQLARDRGLVF